MIIEYIFLTFPPNIDCGYSLQPPHRDGSYDHLQTVFRAKIRSPMHTSVNPIFPILNGVFQVFYFMDLITWWSAASNSKRRGILFRIACLIPSQFLDNFVINANINCRHTIPLTASLIDPDICVLLFLRQILYRLINDRPLLFFAQWKDAND